MEEFAESGTDPLTASLYQMDLDRTQFLLRSYLRIRLQKVPANVICVGCFYGFFFGSMETWVFFINKAVSCSVSGLLR